MLQASCHRADRALAPRPKQMNLRESLYVRMYVRTYRVADVIMTLARGKTNDDAWNGMTFDLLVTTTS